MWAYTLPSRFGCPSVVNWCGLPSLAGLRTGLYKRGSPWEQKTFLIYTYTRLKVDDLICRRGIIYWVQKRLAITLSGLMKPDTHLDKNAYHRDRPDDQTMPRLRVLVQARSGECDARPKL